MVYNQSNLPMIKVVIIIIIIIITMLLLYFNSCFVNIFFYNW